MAVVADTAVAVVAVASVASLLQLSPASSVVVEAAVSGVLREGGSRREVGAAVGAAVFSWRAAQEPGRSSNRARRAAGAAHQLLGAPAAPAIVEFSAPGEVTPG